MITGAEIQAFADEWAIAPAKAERDYVSGWLAAGIATHPLLGSAFTITGGTCLRKAFLETFRFSGDLSFTLTDAAAIQPVRLHDALADIASWITRFGGIEMPRDQVQFELGHGEPGELIGQGSVRYRGPLMQPSVRGAMSEAPTFTIRLFAGDGTSTPRPTRRLGHPYSDAPVGGIVIPCPTIDELFCERLLALTHAPTPGDVYDVVTLFRDEASRPAAQAVRARLEEKGAAKRWSALTEQRFAPIAVQLRETWQAELETQLAAVPPFDAIWEVLPAIVSWLETGFVAPGPAPIAFGDGFAPYRLAPDEPRARRLFRSAYVELIRFAAMNRLCLDVDYENASGDISARLVEPYSLRRSARGDVMLLATHRDVRNLRSYRLDRIRGVRITTQPFAPRYAADPGPNYDTPPEGSSAALRAASLASGPPLATAGDGAAFGTAGLGRPGARLQAPGSR